jgi:hypothetical protein
MMNFIASVIRMLLIVTVASMGFAEADDSGANLDADIESLEQELMNLNADLLILEEDLLYPASSRVAIYLSLDVGEFFRLDAVTVKLNGKEVSHHLYTDRQTGALYRGGVQQLYVGNARQGKNELTAVFVGKGPRERDYKRAVTTDFEQSFEPVYVELSITDSIASQQPEFVARVH